MAAFDVLARLAEGREAMDAAQAYVSAIKLRGYAHPDLTRYSGQVLDWYGGLDGLDLNTLDADCQSLRAAAFRAASALNDVRGVVVGLPGGWRGQGAAGVTDFLAGHCDTAQRSVEALEVAQSSYAALRDELWTLVDRQVSATLAMAEQGRPEWVAAARAVLAGDAGRGEAGDVVDSQVKPFVDKVIGGEWLVSMQSVADAVADAYRVANARVGALGGLMFEVPGGFLSQDEAWEPVRVSGHFGASREVAAEPVHRTGPPAAPAEVPAAPATAPTTAATAPNVPAAAPASGFPQPPAVPTLGSGQPIPGLPAWPELGSAGLGAPPQSLSQPMDIPVLDAPRLDGSGEDTLDDLDLEGISPGAHESEVPTDAEDAEAEDAEVEETAPEDVDSQVDAAAPPDAIEPVADCLQPVPVSEPQPPAVPVAEPPPAPETTEPEIQPADPALPAEPETPCEIAADELPHVGE